MRQICKNTLAVIGLLTLCACAPKQNVKPIIFTQDIPHQYPALSIYSMYPSAEMESACQEYDKRSLLHHCRLDQYDLNLLRSALSDTRLFRKVEMANKSNDYSLSISTATYNLEDAAEITSVMAGAASLFLIPATVTRDVKLELDLRWRGVSIKRYEYDLPLAHSVSMFNMKGVDKADKQFATTLVSHFLNDSQNENVFSGEHLANALQASDYANALLVPERVGDYFFHNKHVYPDPFLGATSRYVHGVVSRYVDVYVYPIKGVQWDDAEAVLDAEALVVKKEIDLMQRQGLIKNVAYPGQDWIKMKHKDGEISGLRFSASWVDKDDVAFLSLAYLFIVEDKFVKFRATKQDPSVDFTVDDFVQDMLNQLEIPGESLFMAKIRQHHRRNSFGQEGLGLGK